MKLSGPPSSFSPWRAVMLLALAMCLGSFSWMTWSRWNQRLTVSSNPKEIKSDHKENAGDGEKEGVKEGAKEGDKKKNEEKNEKKEIEELVATLKFWRDIPGVAKHLDYVTEALQANPNLIDLEALESQSPDDDSPLEALQDNYLEKMIPDPVLRDHWEKMMNLIVGHSQGN